MDMLFCRKDFLNRDYLGEDASIFSNIVIYDSGYSDGTLKIRDCDKTVRLDLDVRDDNQYDNTLHKINTMIEHLDDLKNFLVSKREYVQRVVEESKKKKDNDNIV
jgi:hypothetical protein